MIDDTVELNTKIKIHKKFIGKAYDINIPIIEYDNGSGIQKTATKEWFTEPKEWKNELGVKRVLSPQAQNLALYLAIIDEIEPSYFEEKLGTRCLEFLWELIASKYLTLKVNVESQKKTEKQTQ